MKYSTTEMHTHRIGHHHDQYDLGEPAGGVERDSETYRDVINRLQKEVGISHSHCLVCGAKLDGRRTRYCSRECVAKGRKT